MGGVKREKMAAWAAFYGRRRAGAGGGDAYEGERIQKKRKAAHLYTNIDATYTSLLPTSTLGSDGSFFFQIE